MTSWILDSGASTHFTHDLSNMTDYQSCDIFVEFGNGSAKPLAFGSIKLEVFGDKNRTVTINEVNHVPEIHANLLSTEKLSSKELYYRNDEQILFTKDAVIAIFY